MGLLSSGIVSTTAAAPSGALAAGPLPEIVEAGGYSLAQAAALTHALAPVTGGNFAGSRRAAAICAASAHASAGHRALALRAGSIASWHNSSPP